MWLECGWNVRPVGAAQANPNSEEIPLAAIKLESELANFKGARFLLEKAGAGARCPQHAPAELDQGAFPPTVWLCTRWWFALWALWAVRLVVVVAVLRCVLCAWWCWRCVLCIW